MKSAGALPSTDRGTGKLPLVFMHFFGSGQSEWNDCVELLSEDCRCITIDLPGFGDAATTTGFTVDEMVCAVERTLTAMNLENVILIGHSLSGKVAVALAARSTVQIAGLVLVAPSPPSPEPITAENRQMMLAMSRDQMSADQYLDAITAKPLNNAGHDRAVADFIRCSPQAWTAWLEQGSQEDWSERVGIIDCPALVVTGSEDPSLHASVQRTTTMKHLRKADLVVIPGCAHLPPLEAPAILSTLILAFIQNSSGNDKE